MISITLLDKYPLKSENSVLSPLALEPEVQCVLCETTNGGGFGVTQNVRDCCFLISESPNSTIRACQTTTTRFRYDLVTPGRRQANQKGCFRLSRYSDVIFGGLPRLEFSSPHH